MATQSEPRAPVEDWEAVRDDWVAAVEGMVADVESWSAEQGWATLREAKQVDEDRIGRYEVPRLLIHASFGRVVLDPIARFVAGASGLAELAELPSYDSYLVARSLDESGWFLQGSDSSGSRRLWEKRTFVETIRSFRIAS